MRLGPERVHEEDDDIHRPRGHPRRDLRVAPFGPAQEVLDLEPHLLAHEPRRVPRHDQVELRQGVSIEGRPGNDVGLLVVMRDQGEPAGHESVCLPRVLGSVTLR
jgi:hypothetical protein